MSNSDPLLDGIAVAGQQAGSVPHNYPYGAPEPGPPRNWTPYVVAGLGSAAAEGSKGLAGPLGPEPEPTEAGTSAAPALGLVWPRLSVESWHTAAEERRCTMAGPSRRGQGHLLGNPPPRRTRAR